MTKIVVARCDKCKTIVGEWIWKPGDIMDNEDICPNCKNGL